MRNRATYHGDCKSPYSAPADAKLEYSIDAIIGSAAVLKPEIFGIPATFWFLGGRNLVKWYGKTTITPMIKEGINPGTMENQPFK